MNSQIETRRNQFFTPSQNWDSVLNQEYNKGEGNGMYNVVNLLPYLIEAVEQETESRKLEENQEDA